MKIPLVPEEPSSLRGILTGHFNKRRAFRTVRPAGTRDWLVIYTLAGRGRFGGKNDELIAEPGSLFLIPPGLRHEYGLESRLRHWEILWAHFMPESGWQKWLQWPGGTQNLFHTDLPNIGDRDAVEGALREMHRAALRRHRLSHEMAMNALETALLRCFNRLDDSLPRMDERVEKAMDYLTTNLAEPFSLARTARHSGLSVWRLAHVFKEQLQETPRSYHERLRMERARQLLSRTGQTISEIAFSLGFQSEFYFSRRFKIATGLNPRAFRKSDS